MKTILEYLEKVCEENGQKVAFGDVESKITFNGLVNNSKMLATGIIKKNLFKKPIVLYFEKNPKLCEAMISASYSGNWYVCIDVTMPKDRVDSIFETLQPSLIIAQDDLIDKIEYDVEKISYSEIKSEIDEKLLSKTYEKMIDTDICYAIYTSGSTGKPKGTVVNHITLMRYLEWYSNCMGITSDTIFGGQTPFYFSASVSDFYSTIIKGATYYIIPKSYFMFPIKLIEYLNDNK